MQAEEIARAKALGQEEEWCVQGPERSVWPGGGRFMLERCQIT